MRIAFAAALATLVATPVLAEDLVFQLVNDSSHSITEMYVSPVGEDQWGENILTVDAVDPGVSGDVTIADGMDVCDYDLRFVTAEGGEAEQTQNLCEIATFTVTD
jgi:hypothetical protein